MSLRDRSMITIAALMAQGLYPQLKSHSILGKKHGVTKQEAVEIVTQLAFYTGWAKAWSAFPLINEVYSDETITEIHGGVFGMGEPNTAFAKYFIGNSYLKPLNNPKECNVFLANVKHWHGAKANCWFSHIAVEVPGENTKNEWCEPVTDEEYNKL